VVEKIVSVFDRLQSSSHRRLKGGRIEGESIEKASASLFFSQPLSHWQVSQLSGRTRECALSLSSSFQSSEKTAVNPEIISPLSANLRRRDRRSLELKDHFQLSEKTAVTHGTPWRLLIPGVEGDAHPQQNRHAFGIFKQMCFQEYIYCVKGRDSNHILWPALSQIPLLL
jgi:hypothetical protein